jgi:hypothetical protein
MQYQFLYKVRFLDGRVGESTCAVSWRSWQTPAYHQDWMKEGNHLARAAGHAAARVPAPVASAGGSSARAQLARLQKLKSLYLLKAKMLALRKAKMQGVAPAQPSRPHVLAKNSEGLEGKREKLQRLQATMKRLSNMSKLKKELQLLKVRTNGGFARPKTLRPAPCAHPPNPSCACVRDKTCWLQIPKLLHKKKQLTG